MSTKVCELPHPKERCSVKYRDLNYAVSMYLELAQEMLNEESDDSDGEDVIRTFHSRHTLQDRWRRLFNTNHQKKHKDQKRTIFAGKSDLKSAFRILGLLKRSWQWLIMKAQDPLSGEWKYFVDKCLPFGSSISCSHF